MDLSNKNSSRDEFQNSKDIITFDEVTCRESGSGEIDLGNEDLEQTPKHILMMN